MDKYIKGNYRRSIYESDKGYVIGLFKVRETNDPELEDYINKSITFTGYFPELNLDDTYLFYGELVNHPRYGMQYQVEEFERVKPKDKEGIVEFLASDLFKGVGEKLAKKIVDTLGENTLDIIINNPEQLLLVPKMTKKKADSIVATMNKYEESHKIIIYLTDLGFTMRDALNVYNTYKSQTIPRVELNIYMLIDEVDEITFPKIDTIARKLDVDARDERRIKACIIYIMRDLCFKNGDTYLYKEEIYTSLTNYLKEHFEYDLFLTYLNELVLEDKIYIENDKIYLINLYEAECNITNKIGYLLKKQPEIIKKLELKIERMQEDYGIIYNQKQIEAITKAMEENVLIITGGPGTGKTTIIKAITELYKQIHKLNYDELVDELALLAPTGRAAKRMSESTLLPATTIHRFLKWNKETNEFRINEDNKDKSKLIIVDEVSMIDTLLFDNLLKGLTNNIKLILVGDFNQLPSVGEGQVLKDMIDSDVIPVIHLDHLYRQDENSYITTLAQEIKENNLTTYLDTKSDYTFLTCNSSAIRDNLTKIVKQMLDKGYDYKRIQVMAPMYKGENGIDNLNKDLQEVFNSSSCDKKEITYGDVVFRENDKILQLVNMPDENVFNGDIGYISEIIKASNSDSGKNEIYVNYDGNIVKYLPKDFVKIKHGYVISIHKSQGGEFEAVIIPLSQSYNRMLYRKLIYTGVTRAKKKLILLGDPRAFVYSVANNNEYIRKTSLKEKLHNLFN